MPGTKLGFGMDDVVIGDCRLDETGTASNMKLDPWIDVSCSIEEKKCRLPMETCVRAARARCRGSRDRETFNCKPCGDDVVAGETGCDGTADL